MTTTPNGPTRGPDLRRTATHPDFWYPLAWSEDVKAGKTLARRDVYKRQILHDGAHIFVARQDECAGQFIAHDGAFIAQPVEQLVRKMCIRDRD